MRTSLFVLSLIVAATPGHAASKLTKFKKLLVCAVDGEQDVELGKEGGTKLNLADALDAGAATLESELASAGIGFVPFAEAKAAAEALQAELDKEMGGMMDSHAAAMGAGAEMGANAGMAAAMQAAMNNPAVTPEQREQMRKAFGASAGQAGAGMQAKAKGHNADMMAGAKSAREAAAVRSGSPSTGQVRMFCPRATDEIAPDVKGGKPLDRTRHWQFLENVGADGWLFVSARFGDTSTSSAASGYGAVTTMSRYVPMWNFEAQAYDKKGKRVWKNAVRVSGEELKIGKTVGSAKKAMDAGAPAAVKELVAEMTK